MIFEVRSSPYQWFMFLEGPQLLQDLCGSQLGTMKMELFVFFSFSVSQSHLVAFFFYYYMELYIPKIFSSLKKAQFDVVYHSTFLTINKASVLHIIVSTKKENHGSLGQCNHASSLLFRDEYY